MTKYLTIPFRHTAVEGMSQQTEQVILTCVYCGHTYPPGTPAAMHPLLTEHVAQCDKHPMKAVAETRDRLREACVAANEALCIASFVLKGKPEARDVNYAIDLCRKALKP